MTKTHEVMTLLIAKDHIKKPENMYQILSTFITNDLFGLMGDDWTIQQVEKEKPHLKGVLNDLAFLLSGGIIEHRHAKTILEAAWETDQYAWDICWYLSDSKLLEEKSGNELDDIIRSVLKENEKAVNDIKNGKKKAAGSLIGPIMRATNGKADPKLVSKRILELVTED